MRKEGQGEGFVLWRSSTQREPALAPTGSERILTRMCKTTHQVRQRDEHKLAARPDVQVIRLEQEPVVRTGWDRQLEVRVLGKVLSEVEAVRAIGPTRLACMLTG